MAKQYGSINVISESEESTSDNLRNDAQRPKSFHLWGILGGVGLLVAVFFLGFTSGNDSTMMMSVSLFAGDRLKTNVRDAAKGIDTTEKELWFHNQLVDHFDKKWRKKKWSNRYYASAKHWGGPGNPIFVIIGGEDGVDSILYPFVTDNLASEFEAYVLQTEHRFYGKSQPNNGPEGSASNWYLREFAKPEQALADFIRLTKHIRKELGCSKHRDSANYCPIITVGASYPGFLSAMMRFVYPDIVDIAYASSAPLELYSQQLFENDYYDYITKVANESVPGCAEGVKKTYLEMEAMLSDDADMNDIANQFGICDGSIPAYITNIEMFRDAITFISGTSWADFNMLNYPPYPYGTPQMYMACKAFTDDSKSTVEKIYTFFQIKDEDGNGCFDMNTELMDGKNATCVGSDWSGAGDGNSGRVWDFQTCTDLIIRTGWSEESMFLPRKWSLEQVNNHCLKLYGAPSRPYRLDDMWGFSDLVGNGASYILFVNGIHDGWATCSYLKNLSDTIVAFNIPNGAHHSDLTHNYPEGDTPDVQSVQEQIRETLQQWLQDKEKLKK